MKMRLGIQATLMLATMVVTVRGAAGQDLTEELYTGPQQVISVNPFGVVFKWFNIEYERRLNSTVTAGASASWVPLDSGDDHYISGNAILRYWPAGRALDGFFFGGRTGIYDVSNGGDDGVFFGAGFEIGYTWLMGRDDAFALSLGAGATRIFGGTLDGSDAIPTVRLLNVGIGF